MTQSTTRSTPSPDTPPTPPMPALPPTPPPDERRRLREAKPMTVKQLAGAVRVTQATVRGWETGRAQPRGRKGDQYLRMLAVFAEEDAAVEAAEKAAEEAADGAAGKVGEAGRPAGAHPDGGIGGSGDGPRGGEQAPAEAPEGSDAPDPLTPEQAFDALYEYASPALVRQAYLLTGRRALARESVERAFQRAWRHWPEVAVDRDPAGWVRAVVHEYAMSPWHRFRPSLRHSDAPPAEPADRAFLDVLLSLPPAQRRTLLLYDGIGLDLPETAAETEASTPAAAYRLLHAREVVAERLPDLADPGTLHRRLAELGGAEKLRPPTPERVRITGEHRARVWTRAAIALTTLIIGATALTLRTAPTHYEPPQAPGRAISGVPPRMGPGPLSYEDEELREKLRSYVPNGPHRLLPEPK